VTDPKVITIPLGDLTRKEVKWKKDDEDLLVEELHSSNERRLQLRVFSPTMHKHTSIAIMSNSPSRLLKVITVKNGRKHLYKRRSKRITCSSGREAEGRAREST